MVGGLRHFHVHGQVGAESTAIQLLRNRSGYENSIESVLMKVKWLQLSCFHRPLRLRALSIARIPILDQHSGGIIVNIIRHLNCKPNRHPAVLLQFQNLLRCCSSATLLPCL